MLTEAIRAHLVAKGITEASGWTQQQIMKHVNSKLLEIAQKHPEDFDAAIDDLWCDVRTNLVTINEVLCEDLQQA